MIGDPGDHPLGRPNQRNWSNRSASRIRSPRDPSQVLSLSSFHPPRQRARGYTPQKRFRAGRSTSHTLHTMSSERPTGDHPTRAKRMTTPSPSTQLASLPSSPSSSNPQAQAGQEQSDQDVRLDPIPSIPITNHSDSSSIALHPLTDYTDRLCESIHNNLDQFNQSLHSLPTSSSSSNSPIALDQLTRLIQDNNQQIVKLFEASIQRLLVDALDSIRTQLSLDRCNQQLAEIDKQFLSNSINPDDRVRNRIDDLLTQQKLSLKDEKVNLTAHLRAHYPHLSSLSPSSKTHEPNHRSTSVPVLEPRPITDSNHTGLAPTDDIHQQLRSSGDLVSSGLNHSTPASVLDPFIHPSLQDPEPSNSEDDPSSSSLKHARPQTSSSPSQFQLLSIPNQHLGDISTTPSSPSTTKRKRDDLRVKFDYDESLLEEFSIPDHLNYPQYLKRSQNRIIPLQSEIALQRTVTTKDVSSSNRHLALDSSNTSHHSYLPNPATFENSFKPTGGSKSSRRQSAILRNLVSASLGKLIAQVTKNQQIHWPGSDTEERLAAIGLQAELMPGSKLTTDILHKGPKNLQLQQCKRILLELELGLIRLKEIKAVPRPLKSSKKRGKPSDYLIQLPPNHDGFLGIGDCHHSRETFNTAPSSSPPNSSSHHGLGKNYENCDPALLGLGATTDYSNGSLDPIMQAMESSHDDANNQELIQRYMSSNLHPNDAFCDRARDHSPDQAESDEKDDIRVEKDHDD